MKYYFSFFICVFFYHLASAQINKGFHLAIKASPTFNWFFGKNELIKSYGKEFGYSAGIEVSKYFKNISIQTGVLYEFAGGTVRFNNYGGFNYKSKEARVEYVYIISKNDFASDFTGEYSVYLDALRQGHKYDIKYCQLNERKYNLSYITLPLSITFSEKLPFYFSGTIGVNYSFLVSARANDNVTNIYWNNYYAGGNYYLGDDEELKNLHIETDVNERQIKVNLGISKKKPVNSKLYGVIGLNYSLGLTSVLTKETKLLSYGTYDPANPFKNWAPDAKWDNFRFNSNTISLDLGLVW